MKRSNRALVSLVSFIIFLLLGFSLFPGTSAALFYKGSLYTTTGGSVPYNYNLSYDTFGTSWAVSNTWSGSSAPFSSTSFVSSPFTPFSTGSSSSWGYNPAGSWPAINLTINLSWPSATPSYFSPAYSPAYPVVQSPVNQFSFGNDQYLPWSRTAASVITPGGWGSSFWSQPITFPSDQQNQKVVKLDYQVKTDQAEYEAGETVEITFTVTNADTVPVTLNFTSGRQFDVTITSAGKSKVWQMSSGSAYTMALGTLQLARGESKEFHARWNQKNDQGQSVAAGTYTVEAFLTSSDKNYGKSATTRITILPAVTASADTLPRFSSCQKLREKLNEITNTAKSGPYYAYGGFATGMAVDAVRVAAAFAPQAESGAGGANDYSTTNIQVAGVDESDQIKNDGSYIYMVKGKSVRIIKAYPANGMKELPRIDYADSTFTPDQLFVDGNTLIVIGRDYSPVRVEESSGGGPLKAEVMTTAAIRVPAIYPPYIPNTSLTRVIIYDITNRSSVKERRNVKFEADYLQSRKVDDTLYLIMNQYPPYIPMDTKASEDTPQTLLPKYADSTEASRDQAICDCERVSYFPGSTESRYLIVAAIPVDDPDGEIGKEVILGSSQNVYSSISNLYVAQTSYTDEESGESIRYYSSNPDTLVYKFSFDAEKISYAGRGKVPGTILNQFSMDEYDDYFRIATTKGQTWDEENLSSNNLYVLDKDMKQVGSIEGIARGESIKSVRFMGEKAYMVTFVQVDPLFVISLKDPKKPKILGELKIPGYSEYLHPYDEDHLIGFGREVDASIDADKIHTPGAVYYTALLGMKISLFDVSDVAHPKELHKEVIGFRNTDSELLRDHKALLFSKAKNFMAFPITVTEEVEDSASSYDNYKYTFQGAYFYNIDLKTGFEKKAAITHYDDQEEFTKAGYYYYGNEDDIKRIIYIGDHFYTISESKIKAVDMRTYKEDNLILLEKSTDDTPTYSGGYKTILFKGE
ncbi:MAG: beta-propeller domain-containing protein [bacterium]